MKKSWMVGSVVTGHVAALALFIGGCQTVQRGDGRTAFGGKSTGPAPAPATKSALSPAVAPGGRTIRPVSEVGKPGTYTEVVTSHGARPALKPAIVLPRPSTPPAVHTMPPLPAVASTYTVAKGDTLGHIAQKHGVRVRDLIRLNSMNDPGKLRVGQTLSIPAASKKPGDSVGARSAAAVKVPAGATAHKVASGESVSVIAQKHGVRTADVLRANNLTRDSIIRVGQTLVIPGGKPVAAVRPDKPQPSAPSGPATPAVSAPPAPLPAIPSVERTAPLPPPPVPPATPNVNLPPPPAPPATPAVSPTVGGPSYKNYTVKENEDVYSVAIKWGIAPTELRQINNLTSSELTPGQVLRVPE